MSEFELLFSSEANDNLTALENEGSHSKHLKAVRKALGYLEANPRHPGLNTHKYSSLSRNYAQEIFEAYAENHTPGAYLIFWHYGPNRKQISIVAITPHP